jgi:hypothetical protein
MKTTPPIWIIAFIAAIVTGCAALTRPVISTQTINVPGRTNIVVVTNYAPPVVVTNVVKGETVVVTNFAQPVVITNTVIQPPVVQYVSVTNYVPNEAVVGALQTAQQANAALNPTPTAPVVNWALMLASAIPGLAAAWMNNQKRKAASDLLNTVVTGIETAPTGVGIKKHIATVSTIKGTAQQLDAFVQQLAPSLAAAVPQDANLSASDLIDMAKNMSVMVDQLPEKYRAAFMALRGQLKA